MSSFDQITDSPRPPWKIVALVAGAAVLAVGLVVGAVLFVRSRQKVEISTQNMDRVEAQLTASLAGCAQDANPEACRKKKVGLAAKATGAASVCDNLTGADHDGCVWNVARDRKDPTSCQAIVDETRRNVCNDVIILQNATAASDAAMCDAIVSEKTKADCKATVAGPITVANCAERGKDAAYCADLALMDTAVQRQDLEACAVIATADLSADCADAIGIPDFDKDGLDAEEESQYGSSDRLADTDADGYSDPDEISAGYNPNSDGKLAL